MAEAIMLGGWGGSSSIVAQERLIIQQRVQQRLREKQLAREFEAEQSDWLEQSVYRTATKGSTDTTASVTSEVSRASTESATSYYFSSNSGHDHSHDNTSARRRGDVAGQVPAFQSNMMQTPRTVSNNTAPANAMMNSISSASTGSSTQPPSQPQSQQDSNADLLRDPYELRHGRRYLRELAYPLPVDLPEIQRQNLRTLLGCAVFGRAACAPKVTKKVPQKVLEVGCGSAYWSARCHEYFSSLGHHNVSFTGLDVAPLAPDLKKQGVNWTFVQHDLRRNPWPFEDESFDFIMLKDLSLVVPLGSAYQHFLDQCIRLLQIGGTLELWESDHVLRSLLPHPAPPPNVKQRIDHEMAVQTGTFLIGPGTPFAPAQNKYLTHANTWISEALDRRKLPPMPCARVANILYQEPESLSEVGIRRVAIPLGELRWERDRGKPGQGDEGSPNGNGKGKERERNMSPDQVALRQTALLSVVQMIESLEPLLKEVSGKNSEEWGHWWASMMADLMDPTRGAISGECLEMGAWWATRVDED
jgi:SAM-dependent methyltransferase